jgi:DNA-binding transcriptional MerR regulator
MANQEDQAIYSIGAVAHMLDIPTSTLRGWEERYSVVTPVRSSGSQRLYSRDQVEQLRFIKGQIESGSSAADAHRLLSQHLATGITHMGALDDPRAERRTLILIAERDSYAADLEEYFLRTEGYDVCIALDATQAKALFGQRAPDLVVIDLLLSAGAGFRLCAEFAEARRPVLAVASIDTPDEAMMAGASAFLPKPLEHLKLVATVRDLLGTSALVSPARRAEVAR